MANDDAWFEGPDPLDGPALDATGEDARIDGEAEPVAGWHAANPTSMIPRMVMRRAETDIRAS
jgi:hypothetical protein